MYKTSCEQVVAPVVLAIVDKFDENKISLPIAKSLLATVVDSVENTGGDINEATSLLNDRCSCCLKKFDEKNLLQYTEGKDIDTPLTAEDILKYVAYNCAFGDHMVAGRICESCAKKLWDNREKWE